MAVKVKKRKSLAMRLEEVAAELGYESFAEVVDEYAKLQQNKRAIEKELAELRSALVEYLRPGTYEGHKYAMSVDIVSRLVCDTRALKQEEPEIWEAYAKESVSTTIKTAPLRGI